MANIRPFKGVFYNNSVVGDLATVVAPPYDVISPDEQRAYYQDNAYNVVRLILPQGTTSHKYAQASHTCSEWLDNNVLVRDIEPGMHVYEQEYEARGVNKKRIGFIALAKIEDFSTGKIKAHEKTLKGPKADRLKLLKACEVNFSQIFSLFSDPDYEVDMILNKYTKFEPRIDITFDGVRQKLWTIQDAEDIESLKNLMQDKSLFIADGHHRYETALNYRNEMRQLTGDNSGEAPFDYTMMMFVNMDSDGLTVFPTHRALKNMPKINQDKFRENLEHVFQVAGVKSIETLMSKLAEHSSEHAIGMYLGAGNFYILVANNDNSIIGLLGNNHSNAWKLLDVTILHQVIINRVLGFGGTNIENSIKFTIDEKLAVKLVDDGEYQMAFLLNPTKISSIREIADKGEIMPQKSTYFYPKLISGLVFNKLDWQ